MVRGGIVLRGNIRDISMVTIEFLPPDDIHQYCNVDLEDKTIIMFCQMEGTDTVAGGVAQLSAYPYGSFNQRKTNCAFVTKDSAGWETPPPPENGSDEDSTAQTPPSNSSSSEGGNPSAGAVDPADNPCTGGSGAERALDWVFCGLLESFSDGIEKAERNIYKYLDIERENYQGEHCDDELLATPACSYREAWVSVRNLTTLAIVGTAILMVIATALDFGWFSNYTVKKYLARLIAGVVLVQLSWAVGDFIIVLANELGQFIGGVITAPFQGGGQGAAADIGLEDIFPSTTQQSAFAGGAIVAIGATAWIGVIGLVPVVLTVLIGGLMILAGFMSLVFREFAIIMLLVFAPLGVALWFLPGSDKTWRIYYRTFLSLVLIYPIIVAVIAFGRSFIWVLINSSDHDFVVSLVAFLVYVGMFASIPVLFKRFLGVLNQLTGGTNNPAKGVFDRLRNARKGYQGQRRSFRRSKKAIQDEEHVASHKEAKPLSRAGLRNRIIRAKRNYRIGAPMVSILPGSRDAASVLWQIEADKARKEQLYSRTQRFQRDYDHSKNDELEAIAGDTSRTRLDNEAALVVLAKRKQHKRLQQVYTNMDHGGQVGGAWKSVSTDGDGTFFKDLSDIAHDVATYSVHDRQNPAPAPGEYRRSKLAGLKNDKLAGQSEDTVRRLGNHIQDTLMNHAGDETASGEVQDVMAQVDKILSNPVLSANLTPGNRRAFEDIKTTYDQSVDGWLDSRINMVGGVANWSPDQLRTAAIDNQTTLNAEIDRRAAITVAAAGGHEDIVRNVYNSSDNAVQGSLRVAMEAGSLKGTPLESSAPHLVSLSVDRAGNMGKLENVNWVRLGLDKNRLQQLSLQSAQDMEAYIAAQLPRARTDDRVRQNLQNYSSRQITPAATASQTANPQLAAVLDRINTAIGSL